MTPTAQDERNIEMAKEYFRRGDAQDPTVLDLFHPELQYYFPKFGIGHGPQAMMEMVSGFAGVLEEIAHDYPTYLYVARDPHVIVEGTTRGRLLGKEWEAGKTPGGRFCNDRDVVMPTMKRKNGKIRSVGVHPFHGACSSGG